MSIRYYEVDLTGVALCVVSSEKETTIYKWKNGKWEKADTMYSGIFSDDIPTTPIEIGDSTWIKLNLHEK